MLFQPKESLAYSLCCFCAMFRTQESWKDCPWSRLLWWIGLSLTALIGRRQAAGPFSSHLQTHPTPLSPISEEQIFGLGNRALLKPLFLRLPCRAWNYFYFLLCYIPVLSQWIKGVHCVIGKRKFYKLDSGTGKPHTLHMFLTSYLIWAGQSAMFKPGLMVPTPKGCCKNWKQYDTLVSVGK